MFKCLLVSFNRLTREVPWNEVYLNFNEKILREYPEEEHRKLILQKLDGITIKYLVKHNNKTSALHIRRYQSSDDLETVRSVVNEAYRGLYQELGVGRVERLEAVGDLATQHLHLATHGDQVVGVIVLTPAHDDDTAAAIGRYPHYPHIE